jgi:hypothetical protein
METDEDVKNYMLDTITLISKGFSKKYQFS